MKIKVGELRRLIREAAGAPAWDRLTDIDPTNAFNGSDYPDVLGDEVVNELNLAREKLILNFLPAMEKAAAEWQKLLAQAEAKAGAR